MSDIELPFFAGVDPGGEPVYENLIVTVVDPNDYQVQLLRSPLLVRNLAAGDKIKLIDPASAKYELLQRSGNLAIRLFRRHQLDKLEEFLTPAMEKLGAVLDVQSERALVYSIHYTIGFGSIEELLNRASNTFADTVWYYGNVYDPEDGVTPLQWWLDIDTQT
jgi:hypothetical protein